MFSREKLGYFRESKYENYKVMLEREWVVLEREGETEG